MEQGRWRLIRGVLERRPVRLATVALANKMARIACGDDARTSTAKGYCELRPPA
jgi:hypothetical protein